MTLEPILNRILGQANQRKEEIIRQAKEQVETIIRQAKLEAEKLYQEILTQEQSRYSAERQKLIVNARLEEKKNLVQAKQDLITDIFNQAKTHLGQRKFKKEVIFQDRIHEVAEDPDFYLAHLRFDHESEIANILFEEELR